MLAIALIIPLLLQQDTLHVVAKAPAAWTGSARRQPSLVIGELDGPPEKSFGTIDVLAATTKGDFVLFDGADTLLRRYDATGTYRGTIGRAGAGPGEYRSVTGLAYLGDTMLVVWDPGNARIALFTAEGVFRRFITITMGVYGGLQVDNAGHLRVQVGGVRPRGNREPREITQWLVLDTDGRILDTLPEQSRDHGGEHFVLMTSDGPRWDFPAESLSVWAPSGARILGHSSNLGFTYLPLRGAPRVVTRPTRALPLEGAERKQWEAWGELFARKSSKSFATLPARKPLVRAIITDPADRIWLEVYAEASAREPKPRPPGDERPQFTLRDATTYEVFSSTGTYLGRFELPPESTLLTITHNRFFALQHGPEGEERVAVYLLPSGGS